MPLAWKRSSSSEPKSSPTTPTTRTSVNMLAEIEKCVAAPPRMRSRRPNGVSSESNATEPTTVTVIRAPAAAAAEQAGGGAQRVGAIGALPREVGVAAAEVAVGGGRGVDRPAQVEIAHDRGRAEVEVLADELLDARLGDHARCRSTRR